jgi:hypothetical protein
VRDCRTLTAECDIQLPYKPAEGNLIQYNPRQYNRTRSQKTYIRTKFPVSILIFYVKLSNSIHISELPLRVVSQIPTNVSAIPTLSILTVYKTCLLWTNAEAIGWSWLQYTYASLYCVIVQNYSYILTVLKISHHTFLQIVMLFSLSQGRTVACCDCEFDSHGRHGYLSLLNVVCCQVEVSAMGRSPVQRSPTECGVSGCYREASTVRTSFSPLGAVEPWENEILTYKSEPYQSTLNSERNIENLLIIYHSLCISV